jgi:hypothetical protein
MMLNWLIGRWNGQRIVGVEFGFKLNFAYWKWIPIVTSYTNSLNWLCFRWSWGWVYGDYVKEQSAGDD